MPTFGQLADPTTAPADAVASLAGVDPDTPDAQNLWRVPLVQRGGPPHAVDVPVHIVLPPSLTGVPSPIVVVLGCVFPMVRVHKVLAAYSCLAPRIVTASSTHPAPGHLALHRELCARRSCDQPDHGVRGTAILPEGMSRERFEWLERWTEDPSDIIKTVGTESNVKEIYDACNELEKDPSNVILNQFCEFANHLGHWAVTGRALGHVFEHVARVVVTAAAPRRLHQRDRLGGHHRRRRPPEGRLRRAHRRRRGRRVPDDAGERLRRAQTSRASATSTSR